MKILIKCCHSIFFSISFTILLITEDMYFLTYCDLDWKWTRKLAIIGTVWRCVHDAKSTIGTVFHIHVYDVESFQNNMVFHCKVILSVWSYRTEGQGCLTFRPSWISAHLQNVSLHMEEGWGEPGSSHSLIYSIIYIMKRSFQFPVIGQRLRLLL